MNGIKGFSLLLSPPQFSMTKGIVPDYMHGILLGVVKCLMLLAFDPAEHKNGYKEYKTYPPYFIGHDVSITCIK